MVGLYQNQLEGLDQNMKQNHESSDLLSANNTVTRKTDNDGRYGGTVSYDPRMSIWNKDNSKLIQRIPVRPPEINTTGHLRNNAINCSLGMPHTSFQRDQKDVKKRRI